MRAPEIRLEDLQWLRALAERLVADPHRADDAVGETVLVALREGPRRRGSWRAWLAAVLRNAVRQEERGRARRRAREELALEARAEASPETGEVVAELALHRRLVELVHELDEPYRTTVVRRFLRGEEPPEVARAMGVPLKTVHTRLDRALVRLRERLDREGGGRSVWLAALVPWLDPGASASAPLLPWILPMKLKLLAGGLVLLALGVHVTRERWAPSEASGGQASVVESLPLDVERTVGEGLLEAGSSSEPARTRVVPSRPEVAPSEPAPGRARVHGRVVDLEGQAVANVEVTFEREFEGGRSYERVDEDPEALSAADGSFAMELPERTGRLSVASEAWASLSEPLLRGVSPEEELVLAVAPRRRYAGRVVDAQGLGIAGAVVEAELPTPGFLESHSIGGHRVHVLNSLEAAICDAEGRFALERVGYLGEARLAARRDGYASVGMPLLEYSRSDLEIVLERRALVGTGIHGLVVDPAGQAVHDAQVSFGTEVVHTDLEGRFALPMEAWQSFPGQVRAFKMGFLPAEEPFEWDASALGADPERPLLLTLGGEPLALTGRVLDAEERPVAGALVWTPDTTHFGRAVADHGGLRVSGASTIESMLGGKVGNIYRALETTSDEDGAFRLDGLLPREYAVFVLRPETLVGAGPFIVQAGEEEVELRLGAEELRPVAGRVVSMAGEPLSDVPVMVGRRFDWQLSPERQQAHWAGSVMAPPSAARTFLERQEVRTDGEGRFAFAGLATEGSFLFVGLSPKICSGHSFALVDAPDLEDIVIEAKAAARVRVFLDDPSEADAFALKTEEGGYFPLWIEVDGHKISVADVELEEGRSAVALTSEGPCTLILLRDGKEIRRVPMVFHGGGPFEIRP